MAKRNNFLNFDNVDEIPRQIFDKLIQNDNLFKLLAYDTFKPLNEPNLTFDEKIELIFTRTSQENARVYFIQFADNTIDNEHSEIRISISDIKPDRNNLADIMIRIDIICHNNLIAISTGNRDRKIMNEIVKTLNGCGDTKSVSQLQLPLNINIPNLLYNKSFQGYRVHFRGRISDEGSVC